MIYNSKSTILTDHFDHDKIIFCISSIVNHDPLCGSSLELEPYISCLIPLECRELQSGISLSKCDHIVQQI